MKNAEASLSSEILANLLEVVRDASKVARSWADLESAVFDPVHGILAGFLRTREEREAFIATDEYREIKSLIEAVKDRVGLLDGAEPTKSGKLLVRLPKSMHAALDIEAEREGVSVNQLVMAKLAVKLADVRERRPTDLIPVVVQAYAEIRQNANEATASEDRVVADPNMNALFLARCRQLGATATDYELNWRLFYARKNGFTANLPKVPRFSLPREYVDRYQFASELALRFVQKKELERSWRDVSLDQVICDPMLAAAFDEFASRLAKGFIPFEYRWGAISLRKAGRYSKEAAAVELPKFENIGKVRGLDLNRVPEVRGLYLVNDRRDRLFVSETLNLRARINNHLRSSSGSRFVPDWLYPSIVGDAELGILPMPNAGDGELKILELKAVSSLGPILNYPRAAA